MSSPKKSSLTSKTKTSTPSSQKQRSVTYSETDDDSERRTGQRRNDKRTVSDPNEEAASESNEKLNEGDNSTSIGREGLSGSSTNIAASDNSKTHSVMSSDGTNEFRRSFYAQQHSLFDALRSNLSNMERDIKRSITELHIKSHAEYLQEESCRAIKNLSKRHERELRSLKQNYKDREAAVQARRSAFLHQNRLNTTAENQDLLIQELEDGRNATSELKQMLDAHREACEEFLRRIAKEHTRIRKQLSAGFERRIQDQRSLMELEVSNISQDKKLNTMKNFHFRMNLQKISDKKTGEHLRNAQALELRQIKERVEEEIHFLEELEMLKQAQARKVSALAQSQRLEIQAAEAQINEASFAHKTAVAMVEVQREIALKMARQRREVRAVQEIHAQRLRDFKSQWEAKMSEILDHNMNRNFVMPSVPEDLAICSATFKVSQSNDHADDNFLAQDVKSKASSDAPVDDLENLSGVGLSSLVGAKDDAGITITQIDEQEIQRLRDQLTNAEHNLRALQQSHSKAFTAFVRANEHELKKKEEYIRTQLDALTQQHQAAIDSLERQQQGELAALKQSQEREMRMEENISQTVQNMLLERMRLDLMFQTVVDGIITIDIKGTVQRFNLAAEKMFQYSSSEILGKNIKILMPPEIAVNHDDFLKKYYETGVRNIIGKARVVVGRRKDGTPVSVLATLSEIKADGLHIYTGVLREVTAEVEARRQQEIENENKKQVMKSLIEQLAVERSRCAEVINSMLPSSISNRMLAGETVLPERFSEATVLFTEICGFSEMSTTYPALDIVDLLNDLYCIFDEVVLNYNVYKVETIADSYVCVSGVPQHNSNHASEIAKLAMHFQEAIKLVRMRSYPENELKLKVGIHTGPLVAGIVGCKNPRYCLFGDTVNTTSRMKTTCEARRIHLSSTAHAALQRAEGSPFSMTCRGEVSVKGKGNMVTYYLDSIEGFQANLSSLKEMKLLQSVGSLSNMADIRAVPNAEAGGGQESGGAAGWARQQMAA